jgi:hypothetical protein
MPEFFSLPLLLVSGPSSGSSTSNSLDANPCMAAGAGEMQMWEDASSSSSPHSNEQMSIHTSMAAVSPDFSDGQSTSAHSTLYAHSSQMVSQRVQNLCRNSDLVSVQTCERCMYCTHVLNTIRFFEHSFGLRKEADGPDDQVV